MNYCQSCGTEVTESDSFCPECGDSLDTGQTKDTSTGETASCEKCGSQIPIEADRCPECGHEPSASGILGGLLATLSIIAVIGIAGFILITWIVAFGTDFGFTGALYISVFFLVIGLIPGGIVYAKFNQELKKPTGEKKDWREELLNN